MKLASEIIPKSKKEGMTDGILNVINKHSMATQEKENKTIRTSGEVKKKNTRINIKFFVLPTKL